MAVTKENRSFQRFNYEIPVQMTPVNSGRWLEAHTLNHCPEGMCVKSNVSFHRGTALLIRVEKRPSTPPVSPPLEELPSVSLGEVKWCKQIPDAPFSVYEVGVKYYVPDY